MTSSHHSPNSSVRSVAVVVAAGFGQRLGGVLPKAFMPLGGLPMLALSLRALAGSAAVSGVVIVAPEDRVRDAEEIAARCAPSLHVLGVAPGGRTRQESVRLGLEAVPADAAVVLCHDAARPFASSSLFDRVVDALGDGRDADGAVPVIRSADTVKRLRGSAVAETIPREEIGLVQTPQAFVSAALRTVHAGAAAAGLDGTDDAMLLEAAGYRIVAIEGELTNFKITTDEDLWRAEAMLGRNSAPASEAGQP
jgi:2-C-methyl-D-erythritol 4-phosphate cytidylyltransferase